MIQQQSCALKVPIDIRQPSSLFPSLFTGAGWGEHGLWEMTGICHMPIRTGDSLITTNFKPSNSESCLCGQTALKVQESAAVNGAEERLKEHGNFISTSTGTFTCATRAQGG